MSKSKNISLTLKQAILADGINSTLQNLLEALFKSLPQVAQRIENVDFVSEIVLARLEQHPTNEGLYLRAFIFEHGAMGMVDFAAEGAFCDLVAMLPPKGQKFLKREIVIYIKDNKILAYGMRGGKCDLFTGSGDIFISNWHCINAKPYFYRRYPESRHCPAVARYWGEVYRCLHY